MYHVTLNAVQAAARWTPATNTRQRVCCALLLGGCGAVKTVFQFQPARIVDDGRGGDFEQVA
jgi:hypothetical protein